MNICILSKKLFRRTLLSFALVLYSVCSNAQSVIDSLEQYSKKTKPGWDQIDLAVGLAIQYTNACYFDKAEQRVKDINKWAETNNLPSAKSYGLVLEGGIIHQSFDDADKAVTYYEKAIDLAKKTQNNDALAYATNEYCKILIWSKGNTKKGIAILSELLEDMDATVLKKRKGTSYLSLAHAYMLQGDYEVSLSYFNDAIVIFESIINNPPIDSKINRVSAQLAVPIKDLGFALNDMGNLYLKKGNTDKALFYKEEAFDAIAKTKIVPLMAWMNVNLSKVYSLLGDYSTSLEHIENARKMYESQNLYADIAWVDAIMSNIFFELKDYEMAEVYCKNNLDYLEKSNPNSHYYGGTLLKMTEIQLGKNDLKLAASYLDKAEVKINKADNSGNKAELLKLKGELLMKSSRYTEAEHFLKQALNLNKTKDVSLEIAFCEYNLASVYYHQSKLDSSLVYVTKSLREAERFKSVDLAKDCYELLGKVHGAKGDYKSAFKSQQSFLAFSDSLYKEEVVLKLKSEQVRQDVISFKNEKELAEQNSSLLKQRNKLYVALGVILLFVIAMMAYLYLKLRKEKAKTQTQNLQLTNLNRTKDKFFGLIAHDLRNPLLGFQTVSHQISYFIDTKQPEKLMELSGHIDNSSKKLIELLDNLLNWALLQNGMIPYHPKEVDLKTIADDVVELLKPIADRKQINLINTINEASLVHADSKAVNTILRNIVSNALKFTEIGGEVKINVQNEKHQSTIIINDTGTGISAEKIPKLFQLGNESEFGTSGEAGSGLGLVLCKELVELNKGTIKVISELGKGSSFMFNFPKTPGVV